MTVTITGQIIDVTSHKDSRPWKVWSPVYRQGVNGEIITVTGQSVKVVGGVVTIELEPGAAVIENPDGQRYTVTIPDEDADLWGVIATAVAFPPNTEAEALASAVNAYLEDNPPVVDWNDLINIPTALGVGSVELGHASDTTLSRSAAGVLAVEGVAVPTVSSTDDLSNKNVLTALNAQTASYTLVLADKGKAVEVTSASATNVTVPPNSSVAYPIGTVIEVAQLGTGQVTLVAGAGVTLQTPSSLLTRAQFSSLSLRKRATDTWLVTGDMQ